MDENPIGSGNQSEKSAFTNSANVTDMPRKTTNNKKVKSDSFFRKLSWVVFVIPRKVLGFLKVSEPRWRTLSATTLLLAIFAWVLLYGGTPSSAASYTFTQNSWSGGVSASTAAHPADQTNWNKYSTQTGALIGSNIQLGTYSNLVTTDPAQSTQANAAGTSVNSATLTATEGAGTGSLYYELSNNGGSTWERVRPGQLHTFASPGTNLQWRAVPYPIAPPTVVQQTSGSNSGISAQAVLPNVTPGNLIVVAMSQVDSSGIAYSASDNAGNTYSTAISFTGTNFRQEHIYYAKNVTGGTTTVTVQAATVGSTFRIYAFELAGADHYDPLDTTGSTSNISATIHPCSSGLNTVANVFVLCVATQVGSTSVSGPNASYTEVSSDNGQHMVQYRTSSSALTNETATWTTNDSRNTANAMASFVTGGSDTPRPITSSSLTYSGMYSGAEVISSPFDAGDTETLVAKVAWTASGTSVTETARVQIRTSPDGATWSGWCGFSDTGSSCDGSNYFVSANNNVTIASSNPLRSGSNDRWFQYKVILGGNGVATPTFSSITVTYVVNAPPNFDPSDSVSAVHETDPDSPDVGKVLITYNIRDVDTTTGTTTPGFVTPSFQYNIGGGWVAINSQSLAAGDTNNKEVEEVGYTSYTAVWDALSQIPDNYVTTAQVRVTINDNESANNTAQATSGEFTLDTTPPSVTLNLDVSQGKVQITADDDAGLSYRLSNNSDMSADGRNATSGEWQDAGGNSIDLSPNWNFAPIPNHFTVYLQVMDANGNITSVTAVSPNTPNPNKMFIKDISNVSAENYTEFISWEVYTEEAGSEFEQYEIYRSTDGSSFSLHSTITDINVNYFADFTLDQETTYYYKVRTVDTDGDISGFSDVVSDTADGQGGTDNSAPVITNITVADVQSTTATITWTTDELSDSRVDFSISPATTFDVGQAVSSFVTSHSVTLRNLTPNTTYLFRVKSNDPLGNATTKDNDGAGYNFTTVSGPVVSGVTETSVGDHSATIFWTTNADSDSFVNYSTSPTLANPTQVGTASLVGGSAPFQHSVNLTGLDAGTTYYYSVQSTDDQENTTTDTNGGSYYSFVTTTDNQAPVITGIDTPVIAATAAVVIWQTNELATSQLDWGLAEDDLDTETDLIETLSIFHVVSITGLEENTTYYFRVKSTDEAGNETISDVGQFTTDETTIIQQVGGGGGGSSVTLDTTAPNITGVVANNITSFSAEIAFSTNEDTIGIVEYGKTEDYGLTASSADFAQQHNIQMRGLTMGTTYYYRVKAVDKGGNSKTDTPANLETKYFTEGSIDIEDAEQFQAAIEEAIESALPSLVPPFIDRPEVVDITPDSATVRWRTNIKAFSVLNYAEESQVPAGSTEYPNEASNTSTKVTQHEIKLVNLKPNTTYRILPKSFSIPGAVGQGREQTFTTRPLPVQGRITEITNNSFRASWSTPTATTTVVQYKNMATSEVLQKSDENRTTSHSMVIENLLPATSYEVTVYGYAANGNMIEGGAPTIITTTQDESAPEISGLKIETALVPGRQDRTQTIVAWKTNEPATSIVRYEEGTGAADRPLTNKVEITNNTVTEHTVILTTLKPGGIYRIQIESTDQSGNTTSFPVRTIVVPRQTESILDVIFKNFEDTFKFLRQ